jgi:aryl-alcohol dehydrogenase-like predicted oxidoreductase
VLVQQGKVLYAGSSNFGGWHIATANQEATAKPWGWCEQSK